jgi:hypothetical protein
LEFTSAPADVSSTAGDASLLVGGAGLAAGPQAAKAARPSTTTILEFTTYLPATIRYLMHSAALSFQIGASSSQRFIPNSE